MIESRTDVLIVGAGPTGLALALALQQANVQPMVVDALPAGLNTSRAAVVHAHTLEMLDQLGIMDDLQSAGTQVQRFTIRDRDEPLLEINFSQLPSAFRHMLMIPQPATEAILDTHLAALGGTVRQNVKATKLSQHGDFAEVLLETPEGLELVRARIVVGADGMHSAVREATSISFEGGAYAGSFVLADVRMDWPLPGGEVSLFFSPAGLVVVAQLPDGMYRIVATMDEAPEVVTIADVQGLIDARGPSAGAQVREVSWSSRFRVHHRLASSYRDGRVVILGDAAHVHSPAGGQGMNAGLIDAVVLASALTAVVRDGAPLAVVDDYAATRRPAAREVLGLASRLTGVATVRPAILRGIRNFMLRLLNRMPAIKAKLALQLSGISRREMSSLHLPQLQGDEAVPAAVEKEELAETA